MKNSNLIRNHINNLRASIADPSNSTRSAWALDDQRAAMMDQLSENEAEPAINYSFVFDSEVEVK